MLVGGNSLPINSVQSAKYSLRILVEVIVWQLFVVVCYKKDSGSRLLSFVPAQHCKARRSCLQCTTAAAFGHWGPRRLYVDCGIHFSWTDRGHREQENCVLLPECTSAFLKDWLTHWHVEELSKKKPKTKTKRIFTLIVNFQSIRWTKKEVITK